jgi:hypothetical protein
LYDKEIIPMNRLHTQRNRRLLTAASLLLVLLLTVLTIPAAQPTVAQEESIPTPRAPGQPPARETEEVPEELRTLSPVLRELYQAHQDGTLDMSTIDDDILIDGDRVAVMLEMEDEAAAQRVLPLLPGLGGEVAGRYESWVEAWVPIANLDQVAQLPGLIAAQPSVLVEPLPMPPASEAPISLQAGQFTSQGVERSNADAWHFAGHTGAGTRVAIIDNGTDRLQTAQDSGDLPADLTFLRGLTPGDDGFDIHATSVAEIIHDMAPDAELIFAPIPALQAELATLIEELARDHDVDVINGSFVLQNLGPGDGSGPVGDAIRAVRRDHGTVVVLSAANEAQHHWAGFFRDDNGDGWHEFAFQDAANVIEGVSAGTTLKVILRWDSWPTTDQDFGVYLYAVDPETGELSAEPVAEADTAQAGQFAPWERFTFTAEESGDYAVAVFANSIDTSRQHTLDIVFRPGNSTGNLTFDHNVPEKSISNLATAPEAITVAAVDVESLELEPYSSQGPTFGPGGTFNDGFDKPDMSGFANVPTRSYSPFLFNGTSAAAPHVAGAAALVKERFPSFGAEQIKSYLMDEALDLGAAGYDHQHGTGRLFLASPCPDDPNEPDDVAGLATQISVGASLNQAICTSADEDWFRFEASEFTRVIIELDAQSVEGGVPLVVLFNENHLDDPITSDDDFSDGDGIARIDHTFERSGFYLVRVAVFGGPENEEQPERPYTLSLTQQAVVADMPFRETFSSATVREYFEPHSTQDGRIYVADPNFDAGMHLILDSSRDRASNVLNEAILHVDTTGFDDVRLSFDHREYNDEDTKLPLVFTGSVNGDGVSFSVDGETWYRVANLTGDNSKNFFNHISIDLSREAERHDVTLGDDVRIKFQQFETGAYSVPTDGHAYDNIEVTGVELGMPPSLDFDGDGVADILCHNDDNGANAVWMMNGLSVADKEALASVPDSNTSIVGAGDFDNNGITDVLWYNSETDGLYAWMMDGGIAPVQINKLPKFSAEYSFSVGDFNGDGYDDILYYKPRTGSSGLLLMEDGEVLTFDSYYSSSSSLIGIGDYNGDGKTDSFWQNRSRGYSGVVLSGGTRGNVTGDFESTEHVADTDWELLGTMDLNADTNGDVVWHNEQQGATEVWLMDGATVLEKRNLPSVSGAAVQGQALASDDTPRFRIVGMDDYNGDGYGDFLWRDTHYGTLHVWLMYGDSITPTHQVLGDMIPSWDVVEQGNTQLATTTADYVASVNSERDEQAMLAEMVIGEPLPGPETTLREDNPETPQEPPTDEEPTLEMTEEDMVLGPPLGTGSDDPEPEIQDPEPEITDVYLPLIVR